MTIVECAPITRRIMRGISRLTGGDSYVVTIATNGYTARSAQVDDPDTRAVLENGDNGLSRLTIKRDENAIVEWTVKFWLKYGFPGISGLSTHGESPHSKIHRWHPEPPTHGLMDGIPAPFTMLKSNHLVATVTLITIIVSIAGFFKLDLIIMSMQKPERRPLWGHFGLAWGFAPSKESGRPGWLPSRGLHRSGLVGLPHPAPRIRVSLQNGSWNGPRRVGATDNVAISDRIILRPVSGDQESLEDSNGPDYRKTFRYPALLPIRLSSGSLFVVVSMTRC